MGLMLQQNMYKFLKHMEFVETSSPLTIKSYKKDLEQAFSDLASLNRPVTEDQILSRTREALTAWGPLSPASRNRKASTLKSFFNYLFRERLIQKPLGDLIHAAKVPKKIPDYLSVDEAISVLHKSEKKIDSSFYYFMAEDFA